MAVSFAQDWHEGELQAHKVLHGVEDDNPTVTMLSPHAANVLMHSPIMAIAALDDRKRPWVSLWGGEVGFSRPVAQSVVGVKALVDPHHDPVVKCLLGDFEEGKIVGPSATNIMAALPIDLSRRKRAKMAGSLMGGAIKAVESEDEQSKDAEKKYEIQCVFRINESLGNCPKYINCKTVEPSSNHPKLLYEGKQLPPPAIALIGRSDLFFVASCYANQSMDTNHRGGPPGFVRVAQNDIEGVTIVWPEYSGNRLYQTIGNLFANPVAGLVFPDFETGDVLYMTGRTEILTGERALAVMPRIPLAIKFLVDEVRFVQSALSFKAVRGESSPYNPKVRYLASEGRLESALNTENDITATLITRTKITPNVCRFRFKLSKPHTLRAGQWAAFDFSEELHMGWSHMRDDDPESLNDDYIRTFTISSPPPAESATTDEIELTVRRAGPVTSFLFNHRSPKGLKVPFRGIGGDFSIAKTDAEGPFAFVAGGVGITPLMAQLRSLPFPNLHLFWSIQNADVRLVNDVLKDHPKIAKQTKVYLTGPPPIDEHDFNKAVEEIKAIGAECVQRRLTDQDLMALKASKAWYICASTPFRQQVTTWLSGQMVHFEDFNY